MPCSLQGVQAGAELERCSQCGDLQPKTLATPSRMGVTLGLLFDMPRSCWDLDVQANAERLVSVRANRTTSALSWITEVQGVHRFAVHGSTRPVVLQDS